MKLQYLTIDKNISNAEHMRRANIITKIRTDQYIVLDKVESICFRMCCTPNDILEFVPDKEQIKK